MSPQSQTAVPQASPATAMGHPRGLYTLFFTEMWERFSYYGMRALLVLFMVKAINVKNGGLGFTDATATAIYGLYTAAVYLVALPGGWIADRLLGAQRSVWYGGMIIAAGHFTLAFHSEKTFFLGLLIIILGTALLKPNISVIVGELYPEGGARRDAAFTIFYMGVNLGATIGPMICSYLGEKINWHYGFAAAGVGMVLGLIQYWATGSNLGDAGKYPRKRNDAGQGFDKGWFFVWGALAVILIITALGLAGRIHFEPVQLARWAKKLIVGMGAAYFVGLFLFGKLDTTEKKRLVVLLVLLLGAAMFFAGFEQAGSSLNLFAEKYTQRMFGFLAWLARFKWFAQLKDGIPAGWFQTLNPVFIIIFAPVIASLWVALTRLKICPSLPAKFALGLILLGAGFLVMVAAAKLVGPGKTVLPTWLIATYFLHTIAELCLSPVGLSAVTKLAPRRFTGQMMGLWFLATSLGNLIASEIAGEVSASTGPQMASIYLRIVLISVGTGAVLLVFSRPIKRLMGDIE